MKNRAKFVMAAAFIFSMSAFAEDHQSGINNQSNGNEKPKIRDGSPENIKDKGEIYANWEKVFEDKRMQVYVDTNNVHWFEDRVSFWKMIDLYKKLNDGALSLWVADTHFCGKKMLQRNSVIHFKGQFGSGKEISRNDTERGIERIKLGSMDDAVDDYVCNLKH
jgi:hypothetical protein